ncbi:hypothetical protein BHE74_00020782 [Ensete ventricosum]|nr:hypothetical protein BHE74_00020782 [Ensete ventricosum]
MVSPLLLSTSTPLLLPSSRRSPYPRSVATPSLRCPPSIAFPKPSQRPNLWRPNSSNCLRFFGRTHDRGTSIGGAEPESPIPDEAPLGEDSAAFDPRQQKLSSWACFTAILGAVLVALDVLWISPSTGFGTVYIDAVSRLSERPEVSLDTKDWWFSWVMLLLVQFLCRSESYFLVELHV